MEATQILYVIILFLAMGVVELFVLIGAFLAQRKMTLYGNKANMVSIVAILGVLLLITAIILGVNFVKAFDDDDAKIKSMRKNLSTIDAQTKYLLEQAQATGNQEYSGQLSELDGQIDDLQDDVDDFDHSSGDIPIWVIHQWFY